MINDDVAVLGNSLNKFWRKTKLPYWSPNFYKEPVEGEIQTSRISLSSEFLRDTLFKLKQTKLTETKSSEITKSSEFKQDELILESPSKSNEPDDTPSEFPNSEKIVNREQNSLELSKLFQSLEGQEPLISKKPLHILPTFKPQPDLKHEIIRPSSTNTEWSKNKDLSPHGKIFDNIKNYYSFFREKYGNTKRAKLNSYEKEPSHERVDSFKKEKKEDEGNYGFKQIQNLKDHYKTKYASHNDEVHHKIQTKNPKVFMNYQTSTAYHKTQTSTTSYVIPDDDGDQNDSYNDSTSVIAVDETPSSIEINIDDNYQSLSLYDVGQYIFKLTNAKGNKFDDH